jgi:hypothetical protein
MDVLLAQSIMVLFVAGIAAIGAGLVLIASIYW